MTGFSWVGVVLDQRISESGGECLGALDRLSDGDLFGDGLLICV